VSEAAGPPGPAERITWSIPDGTIDYWPAAFTREEADELERRLRAGIDWEQEEVRIFGATHPVPRLVAWHGDPTAVYTYSGVRHEPRPWTAPLQLIRGRVTALTGESFNSVLLNRYRSGRDGMGWHADDEPELGRDPVIASVSFGAVRRFRLRHRRLRHEVRSLELAHGSLLLMGGPLQHHWRHALPKTLRPVGERINLTFRRVRGIREAPGE